MELASVQGDRMPWLSLLMEADDSETVVRSYMDDGELLVIREGEDDVGIVLLFREGDEVEIKNLALLPERQGQGLGGRAIALVADRARGSGATSLVVGTADAAPATIRFYERSGFTAFGTKAGFFDAYPQPVWVDGVLAHDMVMLRMDL